MASARTQAKYEADGQRLLQRACGLFPRSSEVEALLLESGLKYGYKEPTTRRYKPAYRSALNELAKDGQCSQEESDRLHAEICLQLHRRTSIPHEDRTSTLKIVPSLLQARLTLLELGELARKGRHPTAFAAALYILVVSRVAIRPIEIIGARVQDGFLIVKNAKRRPRQKLTRRISLRRFPPAFVAAAQWLIQIAENEVASYSVDQDTAFEQWRNSLASCLARGSEKACGERLSLYGWRHVGIATWKRAGFSAEAIAKMAGHLLLTSADRHYASASRGWGARHALAEPDTSEAAVATDISAVDAQNDTMPEDVGLTGEAGWEAASTDTGDETSTGGDSETQTTLASPKLSFSNGKMAKQTSDIVEGRDDTAPAHHGEHNHPISRSIGTLRNDENTDVGDDDFRETLLQFAIDADGDVDEETQPMPQRQTHVSPQKDEVHYQSYRLKQQAELERLDESVERLKRAGSGIESITSKNSRVERP